MMYHTTRIIGGFLSGARLPIVTGVRATKSRLKETVFQWLQLFLQDARCLDAFAGTGALGIEAFSRGATWVTFAERHQPCVTFLKHHQQRWRIPGKIHHGSVYTLHADRYDVIFWDPPFQSNDYPTSHWLQTARWIIHEHDAKQTSWCLPPPWVLYKHYQDRHVVCSVWRANRPIALNP
jgi:16S rRNA (guanine(966)-N(2))-methyltransferase RsmD